MEVLVCEDALAVSEVAEILGLEGGVGGRDFDGLLGGALEEEEFGVWFEASLLGVELVLWGEEMEVIFKEDSGWEFLVG